jgi:hypothetical protein
VNGSMFLTKPFSADMRCAECDLAAHMEGEPHFWLRGSLEKYQMAVIVQMDESGTLSVTPPSGSRISAVPKLRTG